MTLRYRLTATGPLAAPIGAPRLRIPGSALKGAARRQASALARALGLPPCRQDGAEGCLLCGLFGAPGVEGALRWGDALPTEGGAAAGSPANWLAPRARRPISRALGTAVDGSALAERVEAAGLTLTGAVEGWLPFAEAAEQERAAALLVAALGLVRRVGGGQGAGDGAVQIAVTAAQLGGAERAAESLLAALPEPARS